MPKVELGIREVKIDVCGRPVTANSKLQFTFKVSSTRFREGFDKFLVNSFFNFNAQIVLTSNSLQLISKYDLKLSVAGLS
jgi:hypothetical protein